MASVRTSRVRGSAGGSGTSVSAAEFARPGTTVMARIVLSVAGPAPRCKHVHGAPGVRPAPAPRLISQGRVRPEECAWANPSGILIVLGLMGLSSWLITRKSRRILGQALGRKIQEGEETSLRAWMSVPDAKLSSAADEMGRVNPVETTLGALDRFGRAIRPNDPRDEPYSKPNSIR